MVAIERLKSAELLDEDELVLGLELLTAGAP
jgi:hypothetical protein